MNEWKVAASATLHCLTGCAIGEITGRVLSSWWNWAALPSVVLSVGLAFLFGYGLTAWSIRKHFSSWKQLARTALASDTVSIATMEIIDNAFILAVPGAIHAGLATGLFWWSLLLSLVIAFFITVPVNRYLIKRGKGHAVIHAYHGHHHGH